MNRTEHLLACLAEECAEVQQAVAKALRFGLDDGYTQDGTNAGDIMKELDDLIGVAEMLRDEGVLKGLTRAAVDAKKAKVLHWMKYAEERGTLTPNAEIKAAGR